MVIMATLFGMALGGWMSGVIFDLTGSYRAAFVNGILWNLVNMSIAAWLLRRSIGRLAFAALGESLLPGDMLHSLARSSARTDLRRARRRVAAISSPELLERRRARNGRRDAGSGHEPRQRDLGRRCG